MEDSMMINDRMNNNLNQAFRDLNNSMNKISTSDKIYQAKEDPSGLAISERMDAIISGTLKEMEGEQMEISMNQTAEGGLARIQESVQRMYELSVQAKNGVYTPEDRSNLQNEVDQLKDNVNYIANSTEYNTMQVISYATTDRFNLSDLDLNNPDSIDLDAIQDSIDQISSLRSDYGSKINSSESRIKDLQQEHYNTTESYSAIRDVDFAREVTEMTKQQIKSDINISMIKKQNQFSVERMRALLGL